MPLLPGLGCAVVRSFTTIISACELGEHRTHDGESGSVCSTATCRCGTTSWNQNYMHGHAGLRLMDVPAVPWFRLFQNYVWNEPWTVVLGFRFRRPKTSGTSGTKPYNPYVCWANRVPRLVEPCGTSGTKKMTPAGSCLVAFINTLCNFNNQSIGGI